MSQADRAYTPASPVPSTRAFDALFAIRRSRAAARDAFRDAPVDNEDIDTAFEAAIDAVAESDRLILSCEPTCLAELAAQAAIVLDAEYDFITEEARRMLRRVRDFTLSA